MIPLSVKGKASNVTETIVGVFEKSSLNSSLAYVKKDRGSEAQVIALLAQEGLEYSEMGEDISKVQSLNSLDHLSDGDIVAINPSGVVNTLFRLNSEHNALFITDRCNSNCLMCSQPPRNSDDLDYYYQINKSLIDLMPTDMEVIGITGGEPTILGDRLVELLKLLYSKLPTTSVHMLSNGRAFAWSNFARKIFGVNENLIIGIPLYSDYCVDHDYIVQARNAFSQTIVGIQNLARFDVRVEIRVVLHKLSYERLPQLAKFIYKNFPFVEHIAFMGLEYVGYTPFNHDKLWIEPSKYMSRLEEATLFLDGIGMNVSLYNLQHCLLPPSLWRFARKSISDWKRNYVEECVKCRELGNCGGVFSTSKLLSQEIKAIVD